MGREARAKSAARARGETVMSGNQAPTQYPVRFIRDDAFTDHMRAARPVMPVQFSDRRYVMNAEGTLRRVASAPTMSITRADARPSNEVPV